MADKLATEFDSSGQTFSQGWTLNSDGSTYNLNVQATISGGGGGATPAAFTDGSNTITAPAASQTVFAANATRKYLLVQNNSADTLWINFGVAAVQTQPSLKLLPNASFESGLVVSNQSVTIIGPNAGATFTAKQA